ncbi:oxalate/formate MFS antiporter [Noviherbaspirillum pedocola]|uniref:Oxalate/formate MFS antiporter n=1 Tax=Noviherbaspirillum pedocola TaxID=2801341 RepID=A0A934SQU3_9BURK|nr:oxalate/formate MFS antiporter [Noviherbaspirillum pedocola]MBK4735061.1 oxalate/formate MFS antiporter [Noviherbaspirillum pedocola]
MKNASLPLSIDEVGSGSVANRWVQLLAGLVCMMAVSSPQYVWTLFTKPMLGELGGTLSQLQITFSLLIVVQTFLSPFQGFVIDRFGPRLLLSVGAALTGASWVLAAHAHSLTMIYLTYGLLGGIGTGIIYVGIVGLMVQWFPDKRGFAVGMVAAGYGMGAIITTFPISSSIASNGYHATLQTFGVIMAIVGVCAAQFTKRPPVGWMAHARTTVDAGSGVAPGRMLKTPVFWLMFAMMTMMSTSGLMVISQMGSFAKDFGVAGVVVLGMAALPLALSIDRFTNGLTRPFFGWVSDRIGRENTMFIAFGLEGIAMLLWLMTRDNAVLFVLLSGVVFFGWGEIFSLFPSTLTDTFGTEHATTNYGILYMAQGVGSVLGGPLAALLHEATGSWIPVFGAVIAMDILTATLAFVVLKPMRRKYLATRAAH